MQEVTTGDFPAIDEMYSDDLKDLIGSLLNVGPKSRPTAEALLKLPFIQAFKAQTLLKLPATEIMQDSMSLIDGVDDTMLTTMASLDVSVEPSAAGADAQLLVTPESYILQ